MVDIALFILLTGVLIFAAHFFEWLFSFTKIPDVLLLMMVGLLLGPLLGVLTPEFFGQAGAVFTVVVLAIMLFVAGTQLRLDVMRRSWRGTFVLAVANFALTVAVVGTIVHLATGITPLISYILGVIVGGTSSVIVIPLAEQLNIGGQSKAMLLLESALTDVFSIVITIALLAAHKLGHFNAATVVWDIVMSFIGASVIGVVGGFAWSLLLHKVRHMHNSIFSTPAFVFILFGVAESLSLSGPIAALAFGVTMGNITFFKEYLRQHHVFLHHIIQPVTLSEREQSFFAETVFLLQTFFFVFVGLSITAIDVWVLLFAVILITIMFAIRIPVVKLAVPSFLPLVDRSVMAIMIPKGLASAVLATLVMQEAIAQWLFVQEVIYAMILFSVIGTSLMIYLLYRTDVGHAYRVMLEDKKAM